MLGRFHRAQKVMRRRGACSGRALYMMVHSAKYGNAPMPHSIFFYEQYAIHGTNAVGSLGRTASHGCIRLLPGNAAVLFAMVQSQGARIRIVGTAPRSANSRTRAGRTSPIRPSPVRRFIARRRSTNGRAH